LETTTASEPPDLAADVQHVTTTAISVPANTAAPGIYETTTTPEWLNHVADARHVSTPPTPTTVPPLAIAEVVTIDFHETTQNDSEEREEREGMWRNEISEEKDTEESIEKEKGKTERRIDEKKEAKTKDTNEVYTAKQAANDDTAHQQPSTFDWATEVDVSDGLSPVTPDNLIPVSLNYPALITPVNPDSGEITADFIHPESIGATPSNPEPAPIHFVHASTVLVDPILAAFTKHSPIAPVSSIPPITHKPRNFSTLRSGKQNPWGSLNHRRRHPHLHTRQSDSSREPPEHSHSCLPPSHHSDSPH
jgi:hypothetical protein